MSNYDSCYVCSAPVCVFVLAVVLHWSDIYLEDISKIFIYKIPCDLLLTNQLAKLTRVRFYKEL